MQRLVMRASHPRHPDSITTRPPDLYFGTAVSRYLSNGEHVDARTSRSLEPVVWLVPSTTAAIMQYGLDAQDRARRVRIGTSTPENGNGNGNGNGKRKGVSNTKIQPLHDGVLVVEY